MNSAENTQTHSIRNTIVAAALAVAIAVPVTTFAVGGQEALATNGDDTAATTLVAAEADDATCEGCEQMTNEEYVASLVGLTNDERQELLGLYNKLDGLADDDDLADAEWARLYELDDKAFYAGLEDQIKSDTTLTDEQRATCLEQLNQMKELDAYFNAYFNDPVYLEKCDQYAAVSESLSSYLGWGDCDTCLI